jgi:chloramphenicol 3-O-phosphotransferase
MNERELLVDCLRRLNRTGIDYYLTGSMASNYWGIMLRRRALAAAHFELNDWQVIPVTQH